MVVSFFFLLCLISLQKMKNTKQKQKHPSKPIKETKGISELYHEVGILTYHRRRGSIPSLHHLIQCLVMQTRKQDPEGQQHTAATEGTASSRALMPFTFHFLNRTRVSSVFLQISNGWNWLWSAYITLRERERERHFLKMHETWLKASWQSPDCLGGGSASKIRRMCNKNEVKRGLLFL